MPWEAEDWPNLTAEQREARLAEFKREAEAAAMNIRYGAAEVIPFPKPKDPKA